MRCLGICLKLLNALIFINAATATTHTDDNQPSVSGAKLVNDTIDGFHSDNTFSTRYREVPENETLVYSESKGQHSRRSHPIVPCTKKMQLFYTWGTEGLCYVCACFQEGPFFVAKCAACGGCKNSALLISDLQPDQSSLAASTASFYCDPLPQSVGYQNPMDSCEVCMCKEFVNPKGVTVADVACTRSQAEKSCFSIPLVPSSHTEITGLDSCNPFEHNKSFSHPYDNCKQCMCYTNEKTKKQEISCHKSRLCQHKDKLLEALLLHTPHKNVSNFNVSTTDKSDIISLDIFELHPENETYPEVPLRNITFTFPPIDTNDYQTEDIKEAYQPAKNKSFELHPEDAANIFSILASNQSLFNTTPASAVQSFEVYPINLNKTPEQPPENIVIPFMTNAPSIGIPFDDKNDTNLWNNIQKEMELAEFLRPIHDINLPNDTHPTPGNVKGFEVNGTLIRPNEEDIMPLPHNEKTCNPLPHDEPFPHPWDECQICKCKQRNSTDGSVEISITCRQRLLCCLLLHSLSDFNMKTEELSEKAASALISKFASAFKNQSSESNLYQEILHNEADKLLLEYDTDKSNTRRPILIPVPVEVSKHDDNSGQTVPVPIVITTVKEIPVPHPIYIEKPVMVPSKEGMKSISIIKNETKEVELHKAAVSNIHGEDGVELSKSSEIMDYKLIFFDEDCKKHPPQSEFSKGCQICKCGLMHRFVMMKCDKLPECDSTSPRSLITEATNQENVTKVNSDIRDLDLKAGTKMTHSFFNIPIIREHITSEIAGPTASNKATTEDGKIDRRSQSN